MLEDRVVVGQVDEVSVGARDAGERVAGADDLDPPLAAAAVFTMSTSSLSLAGRSCANGAHAWFRAQFFHNFGTGRGMTANSSSGVNQYVLCDRR